MTHAAPCLRKREREGTALKPPARVESIGLKSPLAIEIANSSIKCLTLRFPHLFLTLLLSIIIAFNSLSSLSLPLSFSISLLARTSHKGHKV